MMPTLSWSAALYNIVMTTCSATYDEKVGVMITLGNFSCKWPWLGSRFPYIIRTSVNNFLRGHQAPRIYLSFKTLRPDQNGQHFANDILKCVFLKKCVCILIVISLLSSFVINLLSWQKVFDLLYIFRSWLDTNKIANHCLDETCYTSYHNHTRCSQLVVVLVKFISSVSFRVTSLALGQSYDCPSASEVTLNNK